jgi:predicted patatin/cPLA2 family phospholipase
MKMQNVEWNTKGVANVFCYSYRYRDFADIQPNEMPVCRSFEEAQAQFKSTNDSRQASIKANEKRLTIWTRNKETKKFEAMYADECAEDGEEEEREVVSEFKHDKLCKCRCSF